MLVKSCKKVLIVSFMYPPMNNIGALRISKFVKYLPQFGWTPYVLTSGFENINPPLFCETYSNVTRARYFTPELLIRRKIDGQKNTELPGNNIGNPALHKSAVKYLRNFRFIYTLPVVRIIISDPIGWYYPAVEAGLDLIKKYHPDIIYSSFNPAMSHIVASNLHKRTGIPWVAEFRDPWSMNQYLSKTQPFQLFDEILEKRVLKGSSHLVTVSDQLAQKLEKFHSKRVTAIPNGFDHEDYLGDVSETTKFTITHTGYLYPGRRDPTPYFIALKQLIEEKKISEENFEMRFYGENTSSLISLVERFGLNKIVKLYGLVSAQECVIKQKESNVLLLLTWDDPREWTYPGKIFEYFGAGKPILASAFKGGIVDTLLARSGCGVVANTPEEIKNILGKWIVEYKNGSNVLSHYNIDRTFVYDYTRRKQAASLAEVLETNINEKKIKPNK